jgi:DNA helicase-2/ATP-dependent DNA helicase PcrA
MAKKTSQRQLNPEQQAVVDHLRGPLRVGALAGSGKTTALIERAACLVEREGVHPDRILLISFSVNARKEMEKRISARLPGAHATDICRTFHSIGLDVFRTEVDTDKSWTVDTSGRLWRKAIRSAGQKLGFNLKPKGDGLNVKGVEAFASAAKSRALMQHESVRRLGVPNEPLMALAETMAATSGARAADLIDVLIAAERLREITGIEDNGFCQRFLTFDDMLLSAAMLLRQKHVRERWAKRWSYVMQDEVQDESPVQGEIAKALCSEHKNYMVVGDPSQSIFGWRSSDPRRLIEFDTVWPGARTIVMHRNYRSGIEVVDLANKVIANMPDTTTIARVMRCERQTHAYVACHEFEDATAEAAAIAKNIKSHFQTGVSWKEQAILVRLNSMMREIETHLARNLIPYKIVSGESFFDLPEISVPLGYLRAAMGKATLADIEASFSTSPMGRAYFDQLKAAKESSPDAPWTELVYKPQLGRGQYESVEAWHATVKQLAADMANGSGAWALMVWLSKSIGLEAWLKSDGDAENNPTENLRQALSFASYYKTAEELVATVDQIREHRKSCSRSRDVVDVSTIHRYKGREAAVVYMPQLAQEWVRGDLLEERRVFYVGVTRAMDELWMSYPKYHTDDTLNSPSMFLVEAGVAIQDGETIEPGRKIQPVRVGTQMGLF